MDFLRGNYILSFVAGIVSYIYYYYSQNQTREDSIRYSIYTTLFVSIGIFLNTDGGLDETKKIIDDFTPGPAT